MEKDKAETRSPEEYRPPRLVRIGSIVDLTRAEGSGPGGLGFAHSDPRGLRGSHIDGDSAREIFGH
jgi:hypothetical protein